MDFVLIAGDLFEQKSVDPETFNVAALGLRRLADADIPVFAIEGNHEKFLRHGARTWVWYLGQQGLLRLLDIAHEQGDVAIRPWQERTGGTYFDLDGVRIFGIGYYGARLPRIIDRFKDLAASLPTSGVEHSICVLHTGVDDKVDYLHSGCTAAELLILKDVLDYVALGHVHHRFNVPDGPGDEPFLFNPGALENWSSQEVGREKGFFDVSVDTEAKVRHKARHVSDVTYRRDYLKLEIDADGFATPDSLRAAVAEKAIEAADSGANRPIVELRIHGPIRFERNLLEAQVYERILQDNLDCLVARVIFDSAQRQTGDLARSDLQRTRSELELKVLTELFGQYDDFAPYSSDLAAIASRIKSNANQMLSPEILVEELTSEMARAGLLIDADQ